MAVENNGYDFLEMQRRVGTWKLAIVDPAERETILTPGHDFKIAREEFGELSDAVDAYDGSRLSRQEIGEEAADVVIRMMGLATIVGANLVELVEKKITQTTEEKYPPIVVTRFQKEGLTWTQAMRKAKTIWESKVSKKSPQTHQLPQTRQL